MIIRDEGIANSHMHQGKSAQDNLSNTQTWSARIIGLISLPLRGLAAPPREAFRELPLYRRQP
eukprot:3169012-Karenia_brevis.AAC.1